MKEYDRNNPTTFVPYLDANKLYGSGMSQYLPFKWLKWVENWNIENVKGDSDLGHILEVDTQYPEKLHDLYNDYQFCPEHKIITSDMLLDYSKGFAAKHFKNTNI